MCGRYYIDSNMEEGLQSLLVRIERQIRMSVDAGGDKEVPKRLIEGGRDIFPASVAPIVRVKEKKAGLESCTWGFPGFEKGQVLFNARSETVLDKERFRESVLKRRCLIPAAGFYEWSEKKEKYYFTLPEDRRVLLMAGFYKAFAEGGHFVILTRQADDSVAGVHPRMPLILDEDAAVEWLQNDASILKLLKADAPRLKREKKGQLSLFD